PRGLVDRAGLDHHPGFVGDPDPRVLERAVVAPAEGGQLVAVAIGLAHAPQRTVEASLAHHAAAVGPRVDDEGVVAAGVARRHEPDDTMPAVLAKSAVIPSIR